MAEVLRRIPQHPNPGRLVGFETSDDAGVFVVSPGVALVQTVDFFTPIVDDPYAYGQIAAANALSDVYAMGGRPISVLNIACFDPTAAPAELWAEVLRGMADKTHESGAAILGGHTVEDREPKFGMAVTGLVDPERMFGNDRAQPGDRIWLTKPLGTGIVTTAAKADAASAEELGAAIATMVSLNRNAAERGQAASVQCATDITGFGLAGHLMNVARASQVEIEIFTAALPLLPGVSRMIGEGHVTGGAGRNRAHLGAELIFDEGVGEDLRALVVDPQTSGGLALFSPESIPDATCIGIVRQGSPRIVCLA